MAAELTFPSRSTEYNFAPRLREYNFTPVGEAGPLGVALLPYLERRVLGRDDTLPNLPIPSEWLNLFELWAEQKVDFVDLL
jgi:hypothetical protein